MCIQNFVAMDFSANVLLAAGASPAMVNAPQESESVLPAILPSKRNHSNYFCTQGFHQGFKCVVHKYRHCINFRMDGRFDTIC